MDCLLFIGYTPFNREECPLRRFIVSFTANKFIDDINRNFQEKLDSATNGRWSTIVTQVPTIRPNFVVNFVAENIFKLIDAKQLKAFGLQKHIFAVSLI